MASSSVNPKRSSAAAAAFDSSSSESHSTKGSSSHIMVGAIQVQLPVDIALQDTATTAIPSSVQPADESAQSQNPNPNPNPSGQGQNPEAPITIPSESMGGNAAQTATSSSLGPDPEKLYVPAEKVLPLKKNNCALNVGSSEFTSDQQIWLEILKNHPLKLLFTKHYTLPAGYLQQWWYFLEYSSDDEAFISFIHGYRFAVKVSDIIRIFKLPSAGPDGFQDIPSVSELTQDFISLGYSENLTTLSAFKRKCLPPVWYTLFSIINTCISGKASSLDQASTNIKIIFHGICFNKHYDYGRLIFDELLQAVSKKSTYPYIPFQRFFQVFIKGALNAVSQIPRLENEVQSPLFTMESLRPPSAKTIFPNAIPISEELRGYISSRNRVLSEYCESMGLPEPAFPTQDSPLSGERGSRSSHEKGEGVQAGEHPQRGKKRKNERKGSKGAKKSERRPQDKVLTTCDPHQESRAATQSVNPQSLVVGIEDASEPMATNLARPTIHSSGSQNLDVSNKSLGHAAYPPSGLQLEGPDVEKEGSMTPPS